MSIPLLVYALVFLIIIWIILHALLIPKPIPGIPYNITSRYMPWGELVALGFYNYATGEVFSWLSAQCLKHKSPLVQLFIPPFSTTHPTLVLADLREIEDIVTKRLSEIDRADMMHTWFGLVAPKATIGLKSKDGTFREQRRLWNVVLSPQFLSDVAAESLREAAIKLGELWARKANAAGKTYAFEAQEDMRMATLDGMWKLIVGADLGLLTAQQSSVDGQGAVKTRRDGKAVFRKASLPAFYATLGTILTCLDWVMQGISPRMYTWIFRTTAILCHAEKEKDEILDHCIAISKERVKANPGMIEPGMTCALDQVLRKNFLLKAGRETVTGAASDAALRDEILELLITGHETTASTVAWAIKYLTDNPDTQAQLRTSLEIALRGTSPSHLPSARDIAVASIPYLDAVIAETLRLSNTGPVSFRQTMVQCEILGHTIPAGTPVILVTGGPSYTFYSMPCIPEHVRSKSSQATFLRETGLASPHKSPAARGPANDSARFVPSRWLRHDGSFDPDAVAMLPFSAGSRGCFGKRIAHLELRIMLVVLVIRFKFPRLGPGLSSYAAKDGLTRRPVQCSIRPEYI